MLNGDAGTRFRAAEVLSLAPAAGGSLESDGRWREVSWASRGWRKDDPKVVPGGGHVGSANDRPDYRPELQTLVTEGFPILRSPQAEKLDYSRTGATAVAPCDLLFPLGPRRRPYT